MTQRLLYNNIMEEIWKPINGFEGKYEVSTFGRVKSIGTYNTCKRGILSPMIDTSGYEHVGLYLNGKAKDKSIHRLVAETFIPNPNELRYINHIDENKRNNNVSNLEWCTNSYNLTYSLGKRVMQFSKNGQLIRVFNSIAEASKELNIPTSNISRCCKRVRATAGGFIWNYE